MKKIIFLLSLLTGITLSAQDTTNTKFMTAMKKSVAMLDTAKTKSGLQQSLNGFERVAGAAKTEWLPKYYMAYCYLLMSYTDAVSMTDDYCDKADAQLHLADSLSPNNSEIYTLKALAASARIRVSPMSRGAQYGGQSAALTAKAKELDPKNPRPYFLDGQGKYYTPAAFGGGKDKAKPLFEEAIKKYGEFTPYSVVSPHWGKEKAQQMLDECNK